MDMNQIHSFLCLARHRSYTNAAIERNIAVSTLSRQIRMLEEEMNVQLVERDTRTVSLTASGNYFKNQMESIMEEMNIAVLNTQRIYQGFSGSLKIGVLDEITLYGKLQKYIYRFTHRHPNYNLELRRESYQQLRDHLLDGSLDLAVTFFFAISSLASLDYKIVEQIQDGVLVSTLSEMKNAKYFNAEYFRNQTMIQPKTDDEGITLAEAVAYCKSQGFYPRILSVDNNDTAALMAEAGLGYCFNYENGVSAHGPGLKFIPCKESFSSHKVVLAWNKKTVNPPVLQFLKEIDF